MRCVSAASQALEHLKLQSILAGRRFSSVWSIRCAANAARTGIPATHQCGRIDQNKNAAERISQEALTPQCTPVQPAAIKPRAVPMIVQTTESNTEPPDEANARRKARRYANPRRASSAKSAAPAHRETEGGWCEGLSVNIDASAIAPTAAIRPAMRRSTSTDDF